MRREALLISAAAVLLSLTLGAAVLVPAQPDTGEEPGRVTFTEMNIAATEVSGSTVELSLDSRLEHSGGSSENVTVELRAIDEDSGLREAATQLNVSSVQGERELRLDGSLVVDRSSDYELEAIVYHDQRRVTTGSTTIAGLDTLEPDYADSPVQFHQFAGAPLPAVSYQVRNANNETATVDTAAYLTNVGTEAESDLEVALIARQSDSNIVADRARVDVDSLQPGQTARPSTELTVPDDYNYYLDAVLYDGDVIVDTARETATLDPGSDEPTDESDGGDGGDGLDTGDFEVDDGGGDGGDTDDGSRGADGGDDGAGSAPSGDGQPGFGFAAALVGVLTGLAALRYRTA